MSSTFYSPRKGPEQLPKSLGSLLRRMKGQEAHSCKSSPPLAEGGMKGASFALRTCGTHPYIIWRVKIQIVPPVNIPK